MQLMYMGPHKLMKFLPVFIIIVIVLTSSVASAQRGGGGGGGGRGGGGRGGGTTNRGTGGSSGVDRGNMAPFSLTIICLSSYVAFVLRHDAM